MGTNDFNHNIVLFCLPLALVVQICTKRKKKGLHSESKHLPVLFLNGVRLNKFGSVSEV